MSRAEGDRALRSAVYLGRMFDVCVRDGFRAAPRRMVLATLLTVLGTGLVPAYPVGYRWLADGALHGSTDKVVGGGVLVGVLVAVAWAIAASAANDGMDLLQQVAVHRSGQLAETVGGLAGLDRVEHPSWLNEIERVVGGRRLLATAPQTSLDAAANLVRITVLLVLLVAVSPWMLLAPVCAIPPLLCARLSNQVAERAQTCVVEARRHADLLYGLIIDEVSARETHVYGLGPHLIKTHLRLRTEADLVLARADRRVFRLESLGWLMFSAGLTAMMAVVAASALAGAISAGTVFMAVLLIQRSRTQLTTATQTTGALGSVLTMARRLVRLEDYASACARSEAGVDPPDVLQSGISLQAVGYSYGQSTDDALRDVTLVLPAGAVVALVGTNGSGKSTLVKLLLGMYSPTSGEITVDSTGLTAIDRRVWYSRCTAAFQDFSRFQLSAAHAIGIGEVGTVDDRPAARTALELAGGTSLIGELGAEELDAQVGGVATGGRRLSEGQWQKLAVARALRRSEPILTVFDEPTASLDAYAEREMLKGFASASRANGARSGAITVFVSHRMSSTAFADLIVHLDHGRVIEVGTHRELVQADGAYARLYRIQADGFATVQPVANPGLRTGQS